MQDTGKNEPFRFAWLRGLLKTRWLIALLFGVLVTTLFAFFLVLRTPRMTADLRAAHNQVKECVVFVMNALAQEDENLLSQFSANAQTTANLMNEWRRIRKSRGELKGYSLQEVRFYPEMVIRSQPISAGVELVAVAEVEVNLEYGKVFLEVEMGETKNGYKVGRFQIR
jgi:hypothetical protein